MVVCLSFSTPSFGGYTPVFLNPGLITSGVIAAVYAGTSTRKNVTLDILWPHMSLFTCINCLWYSALNKAKGVSSNGWRMCVQCGGKQQTSTFFDFIYSMKPKLKRCDLCMSSSNRTLLFPAKIFFSVKKSDKMLSKFLKQFSIYISCHRSSYHVSCWCCFLPFRLDLVCLENNEWGHSQPPCTHT